MLKDKAQDFDMAIGIAFLLVVGLAVFALTSKSSIPGAESDPIVQVEGEGGTVDNTNSLAEGLQQVGNAQQGQQNSNSASDIPQYPGKPPLTLKDGTDYKATITTNRGVMEVDLYEAQTPQTVNNFVFLANEGFFDGTRSHRVIKDFMVQFGDPYTKNPSLQNLWGTGGPGYQFNDEDFEGSYERGTVAMANSGPNTNGSQFFIMHKSTPLPPNYVIFGKVTDEASLKTLDFLAEIPVKANRAGETSLPTEDIIIESVEINELSAPGSAIADPTN